MAKQPFPFVNTNYMKVQFSTNNSGTFVTISFKTAAPRSAA